MADLRIFCSPARLVGERDSEYALAHAPARYYSPTLGRPDAFTDTGRCGFSGSHRFMTPDPVNGGVPQVSYPVPGLVALSATLSGDVLAPLSLSTTKRAPAPQVQSLGGQVPLAGPGCQGCGCSAASAGGNALMSPQTLNRYPYVLNSPASLVDSAGTTIEFTQLCLDICLISEFGCETTCFFFVFVPPPFGEALLIGCQATCLAFFDSCLAACEGALGRCLLSIGCPGPRA
ncbi:MAG TPA: hypothetical protein VGS20_14920 [Candidatus Acidoferrales bacterium]|nr:hypothetical protein [Candidatus Acidoferrales bacterium]